MHKSMKEIPSASPMMYNCSENCKCLTEDVPKLHFQRCEKNNSTFKGKTIGRNAVCCNRPFSIDLAES